MRHPVHASILLVVGVLSTTANGATGTYDPARDPAQDLTQALANATKANKRVLLEVGRNTCGWTRALDSLMATDKPIADLLAARYVLVRVNRSSDNLNAAFLAKFPKVPGLPHLFVLGKDGTVLVSQDTGVFEQGEGHDPAKVLEFLKHWAE